MYEMFIWSGERNVPGGSEGKESACKEGHPGSIPGRDDALEERTATRSSVLAWRVPWAEEPGRLQSLGLQRVRHNWATNTTINGTR